MIFALIDLYQRIDIDKHIATANDKLLVERWEICAGGAVEDVGTGKGALVVTAGGEQQSAVMGCGDNVGDGVS